MFSKVKYWHPERQYLNHKDEFDSEIERVLAKGDLILREDVDIFEERLARFLGVEHVVTVASGTDALILSLKTVGIGPMDEVIVPSHTFRATLEAVHHVGAKPVLYDLDGRYEHLVSKKTAAIIPAHMEGAVRADMPEMANFCKENGLILIEDSAQAIGSPTVGDMACHSFYPAKMLGCFGDGGAVATNNKNHAEYLRKLRNHFKGDWGAGFGHNSRLDNLQAAVLNIKLKYLVHAQARRKAIAQKYDKALQSVGLPEERYLYQDYVIVHPDVQRLQAFLEGSGIQTMLNRYEFPDVVRKGDLAWQYENNSLRIPCTPEHTDEEIDYVIECINSYEK